MAYIYLVNKYRSVILVINQYYTSTLPTLFWNLVAYNILCMLPLINHGLMRERLFRNRGSYNPSTHQLPYTSALFLLNWQLQKRVWNPISKPWFNELIAKYPEYCAKNVNRNINFISLSLISVTGSFVLANIYQLIYQDVDMNRYLRRSTKPFIGLNAEMSEEI